MSDINFINETGSVNKGDVRVYALSTCAFCKKALQFLKVNSINFSYIYVDELDPKIKQKIKSELKEKFNRDVGFPFLVLNGTSVTVGFTEDVYKKLFL
jgi:glutaredoxin-like protein NrdH